MRKKEQMRTETRSSQTQTGGVSMDDLTEILRKELQDEDYRYAYDEEFSNALMATQIKVIREQQKLTQKELAEKAEMRQSRISELENVNYSMWSISTLRRLARALGVRIAFRFESWGELLPEVEGFDRKSLERPKFEEDPAFAESKAKKKRASAASVPEQLKLMFSGSEEDEDYKERLSGVVSMEGWKAEHKKEKAPISARDLYEERRWA
jgi:transcriptional regulator with XRE-family HTH domain